MRRILLLFSILLTVTMSSATTVSGTFKVNGTPFTGSMTFALSYPGTTGTYLNLPVESAPVAVNAGTFIPFLVDGNDTMLPSKTYYVASLYDPYGGLVTRLPYYISGSTFDLGTAVPTPVLANNLSFLDMLGMRSISVQQLTILSGGAFNFGTLAINSAGVVGALQVNSILFSSAYNTLNPSSTTCGIQEAITALPASGGTVVMANTTCTVTTTISITKPVKLMGFGMGGYTNTAHTQISAPTLLINQVSSGSLFYVAPSAGGVLNGAWLEGFAIKGTVSYGSSLISIGRLNDATAQTNGVVLNRVLGYGSQIYGIDVEGNVANLRVKDCEFDASFYYGMYLGNSFGVGNPTMTGVVVDGSTFSKNLDAIRISSNGVGVIRLLSSHFDNSTNSNMIIDPAATTTVVQSNGSTYLSSVSQSGVDIEGGFGHTFNGDTITGNAQYGVYINNIVSGPHAAILRDVIWGSNTTKDLFLNASTTLLYPSATGAPTQGGAGTVQTFTVSPATPY